MSVIQLIPTLAIVLGCLVSIISGAPAALQVQPRQQLEVGGSQTIRSFLGHDAYWVDIERPAAQNWAFAVWSDFYNAITPGEDGKKPVDLLQVDADDTKRLTVYSAMNGLDKAPNRLKMRDILFECWTMAGLEPGDLKEVLAYQVENRKMVKALTEVRTALRIAGSSSFELSSDDTDEVKKRCWSILTATVFGGAIKASIEDFGVGKKLVKILVDNGGDWDHMFYQFA